MTKKTAIIVENISKTYRVPSILPWKKSRITTALKDVSFSCPAGTITCLLGPNGAGKTTMLKIMAGLVFPDSGSFSFSGATIGLATPNDRSFYWRLTGRQNLEFFASLHGFTGNQKKKQVTRLLEETGLMTEADKPFRLYSSGMKQRLLLARALMGDPGILLLDEPTTHIDPLARREIHEFISENLLKRRGTSILLCTHDLDEAEELADHLVLLDKGSIVAQGDMLSLRSLLSRQHKYRIMFRKKPSRSWTRSMGDGLISESAEGTLFTAADDKAASKIVGSALVHGAVIASFMKEEEPLLEILTRLTGRLQ